VAAIDIGVAHDDDLVIPQLLDIQYARTIFLFNAYAEGGKHVLDFFIVVDPMLHRFLHVEDFSTQWQYGLKITISSLLGCAAGTISLHQVDLTLLWITGRAIGQFTRQSTTCKNIFSLNQFTSFTGSITGTSGNDHFLNNPLGIRWIFFKVGCQCISNTLGYNSYYF